MHGSEASEGSACLTRPALRRGQLAKLPPKHVPPKTMGCGSSVTTPGDAPSPEASAAAVVPAPRRQAPSRAKFPRGLFSMQVSKSSGKVEEQIREVHRILHSQGYDVLIVDGEEQREHHLKKIKEGGVLLAVCTSDYAESDGTGAPNNSYFDLNFAHEEEIPVWPLRMENIYPPIPAWGTRNSKDPSGDGPALIALAIGPHSSSLKYLDCREKTAEDIAKSIAKGLMKPGEADGEADGEAGRSSAE